MYHIIPEQNKLYVSEMICGQFLLLWDFWLMILYFLNTLWDQNVWLYKWYMLIDMVCDIRQLMASGCMNVYTNLDT